MTNIGISKKILWIAISLAMFSTFVGCAALGMSNEVSQDTALDSRGYASTDRLVTTKWVVDNLDNDNVKIVDIRKTEDYAAGHIPGALNYPYGELQVETDGVKGMIPPGENISAKLSSLGISPDDTIIIYDHIKNLWSTRLLWTLEVYGHEDARIINGKPGDFV